jgi:cyclophilin family peptidyl-prolyl cis-trans isomerase
VNPSKASSGCQFYIVQGKKFTDMDINTTESRMASQAKQAIFNATLNLPENEKIKQRFIMHQQARNSDSLAAMSAIMQPIIEAEYAKQTPYHYTVEQKLVYSNIGGAPHLDANYTVFGEVVEGLDVLDKIAEQAVDGMNRPLNDLRMKVTLEIK